jgi:hypothetical protein
VKPADSPDVTCAAAVATAPAVACSDDASRPDAKHDGRQNEHGERQDCAMLTIHMYLPRDRSKTFCYPTSSLFGKPVGARKIKFPSEIVISPQDVPIGTDDGPIGMYRNQRNRGRAFSYFPISNFQLRIFN